jgi:hypothetical protein
MPSPAVLIEFRGTGADAVKAEIERLRREAGPGSRPRFDRCRP